MIEKETLSAKIRNKLGPYNNLSAMIKHYDSIEDDILKKKIWKLILTEITVIENNKHIILELIDSIDE
jgi:hypothetical protein